ncbi:CoA transferase [Dehalococcoidia bacterium]|nr:CoA transferase [Dehalococcoidia bacterium]
MTGPLQGVRVLDFTHALAGPFGTMVLTDLGAEVINVQRIDERDETRGHGPFVNGRSTFRFSIERGKKGIQIDLKKPEGLDLALRLSDQSDVIAENFSVGTMDRIGLGYNKISQRNPRIIYASCTGFGQTGPYANRGGIDIVAQAMSGLMSITGEPDGRPMRAGASFGDTMGGTHLAIGILSALYEREQSGYGQRIEVSMVESVAYNLENAIIRYSATGEVPRRIGPRHPLSTPFQPFETKDNSWIVVAAVRDWEAFCVIIGKEHLAQDPRFNSVADRTANHSELEPVLIDAFRQKTAQEWSAELEGTCLTAPIYSIADMVNDPHTKDRNAVVEIPVPGPSERSVLLANSPVKLSRTPTQVSRPGPSAGEHTSSVLSEILGITPGEINALEESEVIRTS